MRMNEINIEQMEYLFLRRKRSSAVSERQKKLLFKAAQRHWEEEFVGKEANIRKVDCRIYKALLYQLEIRQIFLDTSLSLKKLSDLLEAKPQLRGKSFNAQRPKLRSSLAYSTR